VAETRGPGHATALADEAARAGVPLVVAVGGDGTLNEVVNGVTPLRESHPATVGAVMTGRGRDACRNLGLLRDPHRAVRRLAEGHVVSRDLGLAAWPGGRRFFIAAVGVGFDALVVRRAGTAGGRLRYPAAVLASLRDYRPSQAVVDGPAWESWTGAAASVLVCNGSHLGGGMRIAPAARVDDGLLDVVVLGGSVAPSWLSGCRPCSGAAISPTGRCAPGALPPSAWTCPGHRRCSSTASSRAACRSRSPRRRARSGCSSRPPTSRRPRTAPGR
jgi:diacylglycerol kinase family enzyme